MGAPSIKNGGYRFRATRSPIRTTICAVLIMRVDYRAKRGGQDVIRYFSYKKFEYMLIKIQNIHFKVIKLPKYEFLY